MSSKDFKPEMYPINVAIDCFPIRLPLRKLLVMSTYRLDNSAILMEFTRSMPPGLAICREWISAPATTTTTGSP